MGTSLPTTADWSGLAPGSYSIGLGDADNDKDLDIIIGASFEVMLYKNNGSGVFTLEWSGTDSDYAFKTLFADINSDGWQDIVTMSGGRPKRVYLNNEGNFPSTSSWFSYDNDSTLYGDIGDVGDVDGDGD